MASLSLYMVVYICDTGEGTVLCNGNKSEQRSVFIFGLCVIDVLLRPKEIRIVQEKLVPEVSKTCKDCFVCNDSCLFCLEHVDTNSKESVMHLCFPVSIKI